MKNLNILNQIMCGNSAYEQSGMWFSGEVMGFSANGTGITEQLHGRRENNLFEM